ncbi:MAG TPA: flavodoxin family protein [Methanomassiliicoccales archaeon]|nr:flavodoxin family protein [Methanomassiliicoccales archaeon]
MKNVVIISGSPKRESNSLGLALRFCGAIRQNNSDINVETIPLSQSNLLPCKGCMSCTMTGKCQLDDGMASIKEGLKSADVVIFCSPVHFNLASSVFHNFVERSLVDLHTFEYLGKPVINVLSTNGSGEKDADEYLTRIGLLFGMIKIGSLTISKNDPFDEKAFRKTVRSTIEVLNEENRLKPSLRNSLYFNSMKKIIINNPSFFIYETKVWNERGWFDMSYKQIFHKGWT